MKVQFFSDDEMAEEDAECNDFWFTEDGKVYLVEVKRFSQKAMDEAVEIAKGKYSEMVKNVYNIEA